jgi:rRNA biogenesis protein RRP5
VKTISKFAQLEFKHGEPERGRTIFEGIMTTYPKRIDLWSIYVDMEIKVGDVAVVR